MLSDQFKIKIVALTTYNLAANGQLDAFNKIMIKLLRKVVKKNKRDWHEKLGKYLWAYHTTVWTPTNATPFSLVYGYKVVLPLEI